MSRRTAISVASMAILGLVAGTSAVVNTPATASPGNPSTWRPSTRSTHPPGVDVTRDTRGRLAYLSTDPSAPITVPDARLAQQTQPSPLAAARAHVSALAGALGVSSGGRNLTPLSTRALPGGRYVVKLSQTIGGVEAYGGRVIVGVDTRGSLQDVASRLATTPSSMSTRIPRSSALTTARVAISGGSSHDSRFASVAYARLSILDPSVLGLSDRPSRLTWRIGVLSSKFVESSGDVFVDATSGSVLLTVPWAKTMLNRVVCDRANLVPESYGLAFCADDIKTRGESDPVANIVDVDGAFAQLGRSWDFYKSELGYDLTDHVGSSDFDVFGGGSTTRQLRASTHACTVGDTDTCPMHNAFYLGVGDANGNFAGGAMFFGTGFAVADDIVGHELTHGVTDATSELIYGNESGAINESMSDVFGELIDQANNDGAADLSDDATWKLGEDFGTPIRSMSDPAQSLNGDRQPDKMTSLYWYVGANDANHDYGGVHFNSGVGNKTAYLIGHGSGGVPFNTQIVNGLGVNNPGNEAAGISKMTQLYWDVQNHLLPGASYADLGRQLVNSATQLRATVGTWTDADVVTVRSAVRATELDKLNASITTSATTVNAGGVVRITAKLTTPSHVSSTRVVFPGAAASGVSMRLFRRLYPSTSYAFYGTGTTNSAGVITWNVKPSATSRYYVAIVAGSVGTAAAVSSNPVTVNPVVSTASSNYRPKKRKYFVVTGKAAPVGGRVTLQRLSSGRWVSITTATVFSTGAYAFRIRYTHRGYKYLRVVDFATTWHGTGVSRTLKIHVV